MWDQFYYICYMKAQKNKKVADYMNVKVSGALWERLMRYKTHSLIPISKIVEKVMKDFLDKEKMN